MIHDIPIMIHGDGGNGDDTWSAQIRCNCIYGDDGKLDGVEFFFRCIADSKCSPWSDGFCFHRLHA